MSSILRIVKAASVANFKDLILEMALEHTSFLVVPNHPFIEIQATILQLLMLLLGLAGVVVGSQLGDQVRGVLRCVYRQGLWNDQQGLGKVGNGKLFSG